MADGQSARCLARCVSRNYVTGCHTATFQWHLISAFYVRAKKMKAVLYFGKVSAKNENGKRDGEKGLS